MSEYGQTGAKSNSDGTYSPAGFAVTNLKLIYDVTKNLSFDLGVENLFDKAYAYTDGYYENGRTFVFNARYKY
ncbi:TonB-dependent receptor [Campylobacter hyointestinalis]|uniref:TonB-dependent receptor n=1 Tax=Campylobacter hyointestinalis TaxID=198 RepID=UPI00215BA955|nr:TonB-dependent receptor [Campylobacter hyointestinalis]